MRCQYLMRNAKRYSKAAATSPEAWWREVAELSKLAVELGDGQARRWRSRPVIWRIMVFSS